VRPKSCHSLGGQTILINSCPRKFIFTERNFRVSEPQSEAHLLLSPILGYIWNLLAVLTICPRRHSTLSLPSSKCHSPSLRFMHPLNADPPWELSRLLQQLPTNTLKRTLAARQRRLPTRESILPTGTTLFLPLNEHAIRHHKRFHYLFNRQLSNKHTIKARNEIQAHNWALIPTSHVGAVI